jgi:hypothetical protein
MNRSRFLRSPVAVAAVGDAGAQAVAAISEPHGRQGTSIGPRPRRRQSPVYRTLEPVVVGEHAADPPLESQVSAMLSW